jgi:hypothetical protein
MFQPTGKNPVGYRKLMIVLWFFFEFVRAIVGYLLTGLGNSIELSFNAVSYLFALIGAVFGGSFSYFFIKAIAEKKYPGLIILAYIELVVWIMTINSLFKWISYNVFQYYSLFANIQLLIAIGIPILTMPLIVYGFIRLHYWLGLILGISVSTVIFLNTITMKFMAAFYGYDTEWKKAILPIPMITPLLTKYKKAFALSTQTKDDLLLLGSARN